jgi:hypothetical protein
VGKDYMAMALSYLCREIPYGHALSNMCRKRWYGEEKNDIAMFKMSVYRKMI